jgi:hypothetical protein
MENAHQPPQNRSADRLSARLDRTPAIGCSAPLLRALARARSPEEAASVLFGQQIDVSGLPVEALRVLEQLDRAADIFSSEQPVVVRQARSAFFATTRGQRTVTRAPAFSEPVLAGSERLPGGLRLSRLATRLEELIHVAEDEKRMLQARSKARFADDDAQARAEGSEGQAATAKKEQEIDLDALGREVADEVSRQFEHRRHRQGEDAHG